MDFMKKITDIRRAYGEKSGYKLEDREEFGTVRAILTKFGMPTRNFDSNLSTLIINEEETNSEYVAGTYIARTNTLNMPSEKADRVHELLHMASNDMDHPDELEGCKTRGPSGLFGNSLNEGITDYFTKLAMPKYMNKYPYEAFFVHYINKMYGMDVFREHFNGDAKAFYASFKQDELFIRSFVQELDKFHNLSQEFFKRPQDQPLDKDQADKISDAFIDCVSSFVKLLLLKKLDEKEFLQDLNALMSSNDNDYVNLIDMFFILGTYQSKDRIFTTIKEEIGEEGFVRA